MELFCELFREACTCFLLSYLVVKIISLIVSSDDDDDSVSGSIGTKRTVTVDHHLLNDDDDEQEKNKQQQQQQQQEQLKFDDRFMGFPSTQNKRIKFVDSPVKLAEFQSAEEIFVKDIDEVACEVNVVDDNFSKKFIEEVFNQEIIKSVEFGKELVYLGEKIVGFEDKVGGELESAKRIDVDHKREQIVGLEDMEIHENGEVLDGKEFGDERKEENSNKAEISGREFENTGVSSDDEEWEGIERTELEKKFAKTMNMVGCKDNQGRLAKAGNDIVIQLHGLQKIAMQGPCHEPQPMALKRSARAKWNAWQKLGSMTREDAMEQYISLISDNVPEWMEDNSSADWTSRSSKTAVDSSPEAK